MIAKWKGMPQSDLLLLLLYCHNLICCYYYYLTIIWCVDVVVILSQFNLLILFCHPTIVWYDVVLALNFNCCTLHTWNMEGEQDHNQGTIATSNTRTSSPTQETTHMNKTRGAWERDGLLTSKWCRFVTTQDHYRWTLDAFSAFMWLGYKKQRRGSKIEPNGEL
jgi:hypothetical protein